MAKIRTEYEIGLKDDTSRSLSRITAGLDKFKVAIAGIGAIGGAGAFAAVTARISSAIDLADQLNKASQKAGVTVEALSALNYAAKLSDVSTEGLVGGLEKLSRTMSQAASGSKAQVAAFESIGIAFKNTDGTLRDTTDVFGDIAKAFATLPDGATKTALAMQLFGKTGADLIPLLNSNADGFKAVTAEAKAFGVVLSKDLAQQSENLKDNFTKLEVASSALGITLARDIVPALADLTAEFVKNYTQGSGLLRTFDALAISIGNIARGSDQQRLGQLLVDEIGLEKEILDLQKAFDKGDVGKLPFTIKMRGLRSELESVRKEAQGLQAVMQPEQTGAGRRPTEQFGPPITDAQKRANEARVRAMLDSAAARDAAAKKDAAERDRLQKAQDAYVAKLREQVALEGDVSNEARVQWEIKNGEAAKYSEKVKDEALEAAKALDILEGTADVQQALNGYVRERAELEGKSVKDLAAHRQEIIESLQTPLEKYVDTVKELLTLGLTSDQLSKGITAARIEMTEAQNKALGLRDTARDVGLTFSSAFAQAVTGGEKLRSVITGLASDLTTILLNKSITTPLGNLLGGTEGSPGLIEKGASSFGQWLGGLFGGGKASGGPVSAGKFYMVGENGPELFAPGMNGSIIPNGSSGGGVVVNVHNYGPQQDVSAKSDGRTVDVIIGSSLAKSVAAGRTRNIGLKPALAGR
jgi:hypothetical protein